MSWLQAATLIASSLTLALVALSVVIAIQRRRVRRARRDAAAIKAQAKRTAARWRRQIGER